MSDTDPLVTQNKTAGDPASDLSRRTALLTVAGLMGGLTGCSDTESASNAESNDENTETTSQQEHTSEQENSQQEHTSEEKQDPSNESKSEADDTDATDEAMTDDHENESTDDNEISPTATLVIDYEGDWSGTLETDDLNRSISGSSPKTIDIEGDNGSIMVSATITKDDNSTNTLLVQLIVDQQVVQSSSTNSQSATVTVSYQYQTE